MNLPNLFRLLLFGVLSSDNNSATWHKLHFYIPSTVAVCAGFNLRSLYSNAEKCWLDVGTQRVTPLNIQWDNGFHFLLVKLVTNQKWKPLISHSQGSANLLVHALLETFVDWIQESDFCICGSCVHFNGEQAAGRKWGSCKLLKV